MPDQEKVIFRRGLSTSLPTELVAGTILIETDTGNMYVDDSSSVRFQITDTRLSTKIDNVVVQYGYISNGVLQGDLNANSHRLTNLAAPIDDNDAVTKLHIDTNFLKLSGGTMTGALDMGTNKITSSYTPANDKDLVNKAYVDSVISTGGVPASPGPGYILVSTATGFEWTQQMPYGVIIDDNATE